MVLPSSYIVSGDLTKVGDYPIAQGGFADVWEGTHCGRDVCVKQLRISLSDPALEKVRTGACTRVLKKTHGRRSHSSKRSLYGKG